MKLHRLACSILLLTAGTIANAMTIDAKALARFDVSYATCEAKFPSMRGQADEAYLSLWRVKLDDATRAQLTASRRSPAYKTERQRMLRHAAKATSPASAASNAATLDRECQALAAETQRVTKTKR
jgi:hypothetical protein